jgi:hypothetical protein
VNIFIICDVHFFLMLQSVLWLKINLSKSENYLVGVVDDVESLASIMECVVALLLMKYLGIPLGAHHTCLLLYLVVL